jgi:hypothetical protein
MEKRQLASTYNALEEWQLAGADYAMESVTPN